MSIMANTDDHMHNESIIWWTVMRQCSVRRTVELCLTLRISILYPATLEEISLAGFNSSVVQIKLTVLRLNGLPKFTIISSVGWGSKGLKVPSPWGGELLTTVLRCIKAWLNGIYVTRKDYGITWLIRGSSSMCSRDSSSVVPMVEGLSVLETMVFVCFSSCVLWPLKPSCEYCGW